MQRAVDANRAPGKPIDFWHLKLPTRDPRATYRSCWRCAASSPNPAAYGLEFSQIDERAVLRAGQHRRPDRPAGGRARSPASRNEELYELNPAFHRWATDPTGPVPPAGADRCGRRSRADALAADARAAHARRALHGAARRHARRDRQAEFETTPKLLRHLNDLPSGDELSVGDDADGAVGRRSSCRRRRCAPPRWSIGRGRCRAAARTVLHVVRRGDTLTHRSSARHRRAHARR